MQVQATSNQSSTTETTRKTNDELGKDEFLNLLVTQLRNQNPLEPMEDKEFIAQMAQFSSLEQMQNLVKVTQMQQATGMLGNQIKAEVTTDGVTELVYGRVTSIYENSGKMYVTLSSGRQIEADEVSSVLNDEGYYQEALGLEGRSVYVRKNNSDGQTTDVYRTTIKDVTLENGILKLKTSEGVAIGMEDIWNIIADEAEL